MTENTREGVLKSMQLAAERMGLDLEDLQEMINEVLEDCDQKARQLKDAIAAHDEEKIKSIAHDIKGSTANYGLQEASTLALEIEKKCSSVPMETIEALVKQFENLSTLNLDEND